MFSNAGIGAAPREGWTRVPHLLGVRAQNSVGRWRAAVIHLSWSIWCDGIENLGKLSGHCFLPLAGCLVK